MRRVDPLHAALVVRVRLDLPAGVEAGGAGGDVREPGIDGRRRWGGREARVLGHRALVEGEQRAEADRVAGQVVIGIAGRLIPCDCPPIVVKDEVGGLNRDVRVDERAAANAGGAQDGDAVVSAQAEAEQALAAEVG